MKQRQLWTSRVSESRSLLPVVFFFSLVNKWERRIHYQTIEAVSAVTIVKSLRRRRSFTNRDLILHLKYVKNQSTSAKKSIKTLLNALRCM